MSPVNYKEQWREPRSIFSEKKEKGILMYLSMGEVPNQCSPSTQCIEQDVGALGLQGEFGQQ